MVTKTKRGMFDPLAGGGAVTTPRPPAKKRQKKFQYDLTHATVAVSIEKTAKTFLKKHAQQRGVSLSELIRPKLVELLAELGYS